jgi:mono/diheme cytochrome c family protein
MLFVISLTFFVVACSGNTSDEAAEAEHVEEEHMDEHEEDMHEQDDGQMDHMHVEAPDEFASLSNPFAGDADAITAGQEIFETNCETCHGPEGAGDGPGAVGLDPKPANLGDNVMMSTLTDGYLFWRVSKGGAFEPFNSAMPSWEQSLTEEQRWQVISYVRTFSEQ